MPAFGTATPLPYAPMGRFSHEALAVDPATGIVYETEDAGNTSGFYRFLPNVPGQLAMGGPLEMLGIDGAPGYDTIETTLFSPWWFVGPGYEAYITVRNNTVSAGSDPGHPVRVLMYDQSGAICGIQDIANVPANGNAFVRVGAFPNCVAAGSGSAAIAFMGTPGGMVANTTILNVSAGISFDEPFQPRMMWGTFR